MSYPDLETQGPVRGVVLRVEMHTLIGLSYYDSFEHDVSVQTLCISVGASFDIYCLGEVYT